MKMEWSAEPQLIGPHRPWEGICQEAKLHHWVIHQFCRSAVDETVVF